MNYSDHEFGTDLLAQLDLGYDPVRIAQWADSVFFRPYFNYSNGVRATLIDLFTMQEGEEFHIPEEVLRAKAQHFLTST
jgi:hypothetical protein